MKTIEVEVIRTRTVKVPVQQEDRWKQYIELGLPDNSIFRQFTTLWLINHLKRKRRKVSHS